mgnify:CR=1 FL=1
MYNVILTDGQEVQVKSIDTAIFLQLVELEKTRFFNAAEVKKNFWETISYRWETEQARNLAGLQRVRDAKREQEKTRIEQIEQIEVRRRRNQELAFIRQARRLTGTL